MSNIYVLNRVWRKCCLFNHDILLNCLSSPVAAFLCGCFHHMHSVKIISVELFNVSFSSLYLLKDSY